MKKEMLSFLFLIAMTNFASAQGISDILNSFDETTLILYATFIISFTILFFALQKTLFKGNTAPSGIIAAAISLILVYWVNKTGFDVGGFFIDFGVSESIIVTIVPIIIIAGIVFVIIKLKRNSIYFFGGLFILLGIFLSYSRVLFWVIGGGLIAIGIWLNKKKPLGRQIIIK